MLTERDLTLWGEAYSRRHRCPPSNNTVKYAHKKACEYVDLHCAGMISAVRYGVCGAVMAYMLEGDVGERRLLRASVDSLILLGRSIPVTE